MSYDSSERIKREVRDIHVRLFYSPLLSAVAALPASRRSLEQRFRAALGVTLHDAIIDEVRKESPECAARIVARITRLSEASGIADTGHRI